MEAKLNIAKRIKVGYRNRSDTYNGKLAYVIYYDEKGKLRKETSWESWRDKKIDPDEFDNVPTSGFVLNKGVGGVRQSWGWNPRNEYLRVYDPRGFEFEISVANLVFILQECSSIKGKGLEGEFVYAWGGSDLILLPVDSKEYKTSVEFTGLKSERVSAKSMVPGCLYQTKDMNQVMYIGAFYLWRDEKSNFYDCYGEKKHVFVDAKSFNNRGVSKFRAQSGFSHLAKQISTTPDADTYAKLYTELVNKRNIAKPTSFNVRPVAAEKLNNFLAAAEKRAKDNYSLDSCSIANGTIIQKDDQLYIVRFLDAVTYVNNGYRNYYSDRLPETFTEEAKNGKPYLMYLLDKLSIGSGGLEITKCKIKLEPKDGESKYDFKRRNNLENKYSKVFMSKEELATCMVEVNVVLSDGKDVNLNEMVVKRNYYSGY